MVFDVVDQVITDVSQSICTLLVGCPGLSWENKRALGSFLRTSVTAGTAKAYDGQWNGWCTFIENLDWSMDPYLRGESEGDKAVLVAQYIMGRYDNGARGKVASSVTAGLRLAFTTALIPCDFLDSAVITAARAACKLSTAELREIRNGGPRATVKLPFCESILVRMRERLWVDAGWDLCGFNSRVVYVASMWAYDMDARVSEYTAPEAGGEDHCVGAGDLEFELAGGERIRGGQEMPPPTTVLRCWVKAASQKTGSALKMKLIGRRTPEEGQFLDDLICWVAHSQVTETDRLFSRYIRLKSGRRSKKELSARMIRDQIKETCVFENLPAEHFSSHSLRKAATTHMSALGASEADMKDRGGYSAGSRVMASTYDYSSAGHGPLSSNVLNGGARPDIEDIRRFIPQARNLDRAHLGVLGEGDR